MGPIGLNIPSPSTHCKSAVGLEFCWVLESDDRSAAIEFGVGHQTVSRKTLVQKYCGAARPPLAGRPIPSHPPKADRSRLDGQPIKTQPDGREHPFIETLTHQNHDDALAEAKKLIDGGGMN